MSAKRFQSPRLNTPFDILDSSKRKRSRSALARRRRSFTVERLETRRCLSAVGLATQYIVNDLTDPVPMFADLDGDGDLDVVAGSGTVGKNRIGWFENVDGQGTYGPEQEITTSVAIVTAIDVADIDGDGDMDVVSASSGDGKIAWYENLDGKGDFKPQVVIASGDDTTDIFGPDGLGADVFVDDFDGDGDMDVVAAFSTKFRRESGELGYEVKIVRYENVDGAGQFTSGQLVVGGEYSDRGLSSIAIERGDMDGDNDLDLIAAMGGDIAWLENTDGRGSFGVPQVINTSPLGPLQTVDVGDLDGDGDLDVVTLTEWGFGDVVWYDNADGQGSFGERQVIAARGPGQFKRVTVGDLDNDGDLDITYAAVFDFGARTVAWLENTDGTGNFSETKVILEDDVRASIIEIGDADGDGDADLLVVAQGEPPLDSNRIAWLEFSDGSFAGQHAVNEVGPRFGGTKTVDLDGDGDLDVFVGGSVWYENTDGRGTFGSLRVISGSSFLVHSFGDADGDGDLDLFGFKSPSGQGYSWMENTDGMGTFGELQEIQTTTGFGNFQTVDLDGDGDLDVLEGGAEQLSWYENEDGKGTYGSQQMIAERDSWASQVTPTDVDQDGDQDILLTSFGHFDDGSSSMTISSYENLNGQALFGAERTIKSFATSSASVGVSFDDIDGDGDLDLLVTIDPFDRGAATTISRLENVDGTVQFGEEQIVVDLGGLSFGREAVDVDGDGDLDLLITRLTDTGGTISWFENIDGTMKVGEEHIIVADVQEAVQGAPQAVDVDGDGDLDVLAILGVTNERVQEVVWFENIDGRGGFGRPHVVNSSPDRSFLGYLSSPADLDGDNDVDFLWSDPWSGTVGWFENRPIGDSNNDGVFDSSDLTMVLSAGEFDDGIDNNSTFDEGDWNGDGEFDSSDIVHAFQAGAYVIAPQARTTDDASIDHAAAVDRLFATRQAPR